VKPGTFPDASTTTLYESGEGEGAAAAAATSVRMTGRMSTVIRDILVIFMGSGFADFQAPLGEAKLRFQVS
jgi:hypothetical protein